MRDLLLTAAEFMGVIAVTMILGLSPRFKRRPLIFMYPGREGWISLGLAGLVMILLWVYFSSGAIPHGAVLMPETKNAPYDLNNVLQQLAICLLSVSPLVLLLLIRRQPLVSTGLGSQTLRPSLELGLALAIITIFLRGKIYSIMSGVNAAQFYYLLAMLAAGFSEELLFRGYIQLRMGAWLGEQWGWLATAGLYALWQIPQKVLIDGAALPELGLSLLYALAAGLIYGWIMRKSGNVLAPALYHAIRNWVLIL